MMFGELHILEQKTKSSMVSSWTEYLCLQRLAENKFELSMRSYEIIGDPSAYYDEKTDDYVIPDLIDGQKVAGVEDGYIVGGELISLEDQMSPLLFVSVDDEKLIDWINSYSSDDTILVQIRALISCK